MYIPDPKAVVSDRKKKTKVIPLQLPATVVTDDADNTEEGANLFLLWFLLNVVMANQVVVI